MSGLRRATPFQIRTDSDAIVRAYCLRALGQLKTTSGLDRIAASLRDREADVRFEAVAALSMLTASPSELESYLDPMLNDADSRVNTRAASALLKIGCNMERAKSFLRYT